MSPYTNFHYLERRIHVHFLTHEHSNEQELRHIFVYRYLQSDGTFMLRLLASNVSDYVCTKIILELYRKFRLTFSNDKTSRESLFKPIEKSKSQDDDDDDDESTDQTIDADIPPIPNPRHGKIFIERDIVPHLASDISFIKPIESQRTVSFSLPLTTNSGQIHLPSSPMSLLKDNRHTANEEVESIPRHKSVEFHLDSEIIPLSASPSPPASIGKGPSPYATTYLTKQKPDEQEFAYIDDSNASSSNSGQSSQKSTAISTNPVVPRTHDV